MTSNRCLKAESHSHKHGPHCGHTAIQHGDHVCYLHDGHLHHPHQEHYDEHVLEINDRNPNGCNPVDETIHSTHVHGESCGHERIPHGDHYDYLVDGRLHHVHGDHCDDHGPVEITGGQ
ncbi:hypothetical protein [Microbulbifer epialgicus]|uniref:Threonine dehydratase n=1 Tax=Microbulbifer epialgicus TaxID=393907 RepID=A0ABV4NXJ7_9GAMM